MEAAEAGQVPPSFQMQTFQIEPASNERQMPRAHGPLRGPCLLLRRPLERSSVVQPSSLSRPVP